VIGRDDPQERACVAPVVRELGGGGEDYRGEPVVEGGLVRGRERGMVTQQVRGEDESGRGPPDDQ
jgi:hypothetical protein